MSSVIAGTTCPRAANQNNIPNATLHSCSVLPARRRSTAITYASGVRLAKASVNCSFFLFFFPADSLILWSHCIRLAFKAETVAKGRCRDGERTGFLKQYSRSMRSFTERLHHCYMLLTIAEPGEGTFFTMADAQTWDAAKQCRILDRLPFAKIKQKGKTMKNATLLAIIGLLAIGLMLGVNLAQAQNIGKPGTLDPKFGTDGTVTTIFTGAGSPVMLPIGAVQQASGDIVVLSQFDFVADEGTQIGLTRYTAAGKLDETFGTQGSTITNFSSFTFDPFAFALEPNGKILVAGFVSGGANFGLAQFTANGVLDTTFGTDGVAAAVTGADFPNAFLLQPNGQILMGGFKDGGKNSPGSLSLARFNSNGALDPTFGTAGVALVTPAPILGPQALALLSNGDYLAVGENGNGKAGTVVELSPTGVLLSG